MARDRDFAITLRLLGTAPGSHRSVRTGAAPVGTKVPEAQVMKFGSVILEHGPVGEGELKQNVAQGRSALNGMKVALSAPGVRLRAVRGVPLYHADPHHPERLVRVLDGKRQSGLLVDGEFKAV